MAKNLLIRSAREPEPVVEDTLDQPEGSVVTICEYRAEEGWTWSQYRIVKYYPHIVLCRDAHGFTRAFGRWEFRKRQKGKVDTMPGGYKGVHNVENVD